MHTHKYKQALHRELPPQPAVGVGTRTVGRRQTDPCHLRTTTRLGGKDSRQGELPIFSGTQWRPAALSQAAGRGPPGPRGACPERRPAQVGYRRESAARSVPPRGADPRSPRPHPLAGLDSLTAGVCSSQPRVGAAARRRRRRRDPGPRRRVIIPPARASPGPGPRPPEPSPRPSCGRSLASLPPALPPGPFPPPPPPPPPQRRALPPRPPLRSGATARPFAPQLPLSPDPTSGAPSDRLHPAGPASPEPFSHLAP